MMLSDRSEPKAMTEGADVVRPMIKRPTEAESCERGRRVLSKETWCGLVQELDGVVGKDID